MELYSANARLIFTFGFRSVYVMGIQKPLTIKNETFGNPVAIVIHRRGPWRSFEALEFTTLEWIDWFNHRRLLGPIGNIPLAGRSRGAILRHAGRTSHAA